MRTIGYQYIIYGTSVIPNRNNGVHTIKYDEVLVLSEGAAHEGIGCNHGLLSSLKSSHRIKAKDINKRR